MKYLFLLVSLCLFGVVACNETPNKAGAATVDAVPALDPDEVKHTEDRCIKMSKEIAWHYKSCNRGITEKNRRGVLKRFKRQCRNLNLVMTDQMEAQMDLCLRRYKYIDCKYDSYLPPACPLVFGDKFPM